MGWNGDRFIQGTPRWRLKKRFDLGDLVHHERQFEQRPQSDFAGALKAFVARQGDSGACRCFLLGPAKLQAQGPNSGSKCLGLLWGGCEFKD